MCFFCGGAYEHQGARCPSIKAFEYYPDGSTVKRVEFVTYADFIRPEQSQPKEGFVTADGLRHLNGH